MNGYFWLLWFGMVLTLVGILLFFFRKKKKERMKKEAERNAPPLYPLGTMVYYHSRTEEVEFAAVIDYTADQKQYFLRRSRDRKVVKIAVEKVRPFSQ